MILYFNILPDKYIILSRLSLATSESFSWVLTDSQLADPSCLLPNIYSSPEYKMQFLLRMHWPWNVGTGHVNIIIAAQICRQQHNKSEINKCKHVRSWGINNNNSAIGRYRWARNTIKIMLMHIYQYSELFR